MIALRPYQQAAVEAVYDHLRRRDDNPVVVIPTGGGKTPVIASICRDAVEEWHGRVLVLSHVRELLAQARDQLKRVCPELPVGIYSAGLGRRDTEQAVIVAGIQSIYRRATELEAFELVIVDECHLIPRDGEGMYRTLLAELKVINPDLRILGCTATAFRTDSGPICRPDHFLNAICYEISVRELIHQGYLCPLVSKSGRCRVDTSGLAVRAGEFVADEVERLMDVPDLVAAACAEIVELTTDRRAVLIFASSVAHAEHIQSTLRSRHGVECGLVHGGTPFQERDELIARFRGEPGTGLFARPPLRYLCNINVLSIGFDAGNIDTVVLMRPTASAVFYCQAVGRGLRPHPSKRDTLVLDFGGNIVRHGPIDALTIRDRTGSQEGEAPAKECPQCRTVVAAGCAACPDCGFEFPRPERAQHDATASSAGILSGQVTDTEYEVRDVWYGLHTKRGADETAPRTLRVNYRLGLEYWQSEWICVEHTGYARRKAAAWWAARTDEPLPDTALEAVAFAQRGGLAVPEAITVRSISGEKFDRIVDYRLGAKPDAVERSLEEIPF